MITARQEKSVGAVRIICVAGFIVCALAIFFVPTLSFRSNTAPTTMGLKMAWLEFLNLLVWLSLYAYFAAPGRTNEPQVGFGRITPAIAGMVIGYASLSFALLVAGSIFPKPEWLWRIQMAVQVVLAAAMLVIILLISIAVVYGQRGSTQPQNTPQSTGQAIRKG